MTTGQSGVQFTTKQILSYTFVIFEPPGIFDWSKNNNKLIYKAP